MYGIAILEVLSSKSSRKTQMHLEEKQKHKKK